GLIDITFDEANPPFTIGNSFNNAKTSTDTGTITPADQPTFGSPGTYAPGANSIYGAYGLLSDGAGESFINGITGKKGSAVTNVSAEPTGPNDPEVTNSTGQQLQPGPGASGFIDRPTGLAGESPNLSGSPGSSNEPGSYSPSSSMVVDPKINADDTGRLVSGPGIPADSFVGTVTNRGPLPLFANASTSSGSAGANNNFAKPWTGSFQLVDDAGHPVTPTATETNASPGGSGTSEVTLSAEGATSTTGTAACPAGSEAATTAACHTVDPLLDATDFTPGGGNTGSVLISPFIKPGTVSKTYYNHYSWLRTMEDIFLTGATCTNPAGVTLPTGSVCGGLDGKGHLGYAAQTNLAPFGPDVFTSPGRRVGEGHNG
ncbi:MAG: alkaline phosphatase family protein, partial [Acidimicrobiales bacterium]